MWSRYLSVTYRRTDRQTTCGGNTTLCVASCGKKETKTNKRHCPVTLQGSLLVFVLAYVQNRKEGRWIYSSCSSWHGFILSGHSGLAQWSLEYCLQINVCLLLCQWLHCRLELHPLWSLRLFRSVSSVLKWGQKWSRPKRPRTKVIAVISVLSEDQL